MPPVSVAAAPPNLVRGIRRWDFVALIVNITIGAGILGLPAKLYALAGTYSLGAYLTSAAIVTLIILCFAEVSSRFNGAGGPYLYARVAFGPLVGFEVGWLLWLSRLASFAALCNLLVDYTAYFWPAVGAGLGRAILMVGVHRQNQLREHADNEGFVEPLLWTDIGKARSGAGGALVGTPDQIVEKLNRYLDMGFRAFIFSGYPLLDEADYFARYVLPRLPNVSMPEVQGRRPVHPPITPLTTAPLR